MSLPQRKWPRLKGYDYSQSGLYFVTICTHNKEMLLGDIVGAAIGRPHVALTLLGEFVEEGIAHISKRYTQVECKHHVVMPNHIHLIVSIQGVDACGRPMAAPTLSRVLNQFKGYVSKQAGFSLWQKGFYEHIIRNEQSYLEICQYIEENPSRWAEDSYFQPQK